MRVPIFNRRASVLGNEKRSGIGDVVSPVTLGPLSAPTYYQPFNGDLLGYGSASSGTGRLWSTVPNGNTWIAGSIAGAQAIHLTTGSPGQYLSAGSSNHPAETSQSFTVSMHHKVPSGEVTFPLSIMSNTLTSYFQIITGNEGSGVYGAAHKVSSWTISQTFSSSDVGTDWFDLVCVVNRSTQVMQMYLNGVKIGTDTTISPPVGASEVLWLGSSLNIVATAGSRVASSSTIYKTASFAEYAWWTNVAFTASEVMTLHNLRLTNTSIRTYLGL